MTGTVALRIIHIALSFCSDVTLSPHCVRACVGSVWACPHSGSACIFKTISVSVRLFFLFFRLIKKLYLRVYRRGCSRVVVAGIGQNHDFRFLPSRRNTLTDWPAYSPEHARCRT